MGLDPTSRSRSKRPGEKTLTLNPLSSALYSEALKSGLLIVDEEGNLRTVGVFPLDLVTNPILNQMPCVIQGLNPGGAYIRAMVENWNADKAPATLALDVNALEYVFHPLLGEMQRVRTPSIWVTAAPAALGANVVWAAGANERHRILYMTIDFPGTFNAAAVNVLARLMDAAAAVNVNTNCYIPAAATFYNAHFQYDFRPNGMISAAVNTAWNIDLSVAIANNPPRVNIWGTAEP